ncbi:iron-sulfur cluster carrier protein ApbC [Legionella impletisoli]|uniref:Iron-sulfur cluster carrier protein n=1 Tax=Legionella impletisoli TaxID=343510 RepID=A0A917NDZ2_9GAMM|nr:iron-sulfur cluster carrier protein ApbC [Legionella impletisoli]GGI91404.1 iron-sulfur cluster carrier protein [Legionella impletisoli]
MNLEHAINQVLNQSTIPLLKIALSDLPLKPIIELEDKQLTLKLIAGFPIDLIRETLSNDLAQTLKQTLPDFTVSVTIESAIKAHTTQLPGMALRGVKNVIAIASGKGGVGKSTVAVNLAAALSRSGARVGLLDADIYGPSVPLMLGQFEPVEVRNDKYIPVKAHGIQAMSIGYLTQNDPALIWRGPMLAKSMIQMLDITAWEDLDYLFIDLPPGTGDIQLSLVQKIPLAGAIIITTPQNVATLDAEKAIKMFLKTNINVLGIVENMSFHQCSKCSHEEALFGAGGAQKIAREYNTHLLGQLPLNPEIGEDCERGVPTSTNNTSLANSFLKTALSATLELAKRPLNYASKFPPIKVE